MTLRILHVTTFLQGGAGRAVVDLAIAQAHAGHVVAVAASRTGAPGYGNYGGYLSELAKASIPVHLVESTFVRDVRLNRAAVHQLAAALPVEPGLDVIHTHAGTPSRIALVLRIRRHRRAAIVQTMHGWGVAKTPEQAAEDVAALNRVDLVVVPSSESASLLRAIGVRADQITVVPYGVGDIGEPLDERGLRTYHAMLRARGEGRLVIVCVGTIGARKNQTLLVDALSLAVREARMCCVFVGDGDAASLEAAVGASEVGAHVHVYGYSPAARRLASGADVLVLPSRSEGQPLAVLEAMCDGLIPIVSDRPELTELVQHGVNGLVFDDGDASALADRLVQAARLTAVERRRLQAAARRRYEAEFTRSQMTSRYANLYASLVQSRSHQRQGETPAA